MIAAIPMHSGKYFEFNKNFKVGDKVYWLGHDWVHGFLYGEKYVADKDMVKHKKDLQLYKKIKRVK